MLKTAPSFSPGASEQVRPQAKASGFMMRIVGGPWASPRNWLQRPRKKAGPSGPVPPQQPTCSCVSGNQGNSFYLCSRQCRGPWKVLLQPLLDCL